MSRIRLHRLPVIALVVTLALCWLGASGAWARTAQLAGAPVPAGFVGMDVTDSMFVPGNGLRAADQFASMARHGVQTVRVVFSWHDAQPYQTWADLLAKDPTQASQFVDVGGVPTNFSPTDEIVHLASVNGLRVLPTVMYVPDWDAAANPPGLSTPARTGPYANYLTGLVHRYGPNGTYWQSGGPRMVIRQWQIWNEPDNWYYWKARGYAKSYVGLLRAAHGAIIRADPGAQTVLGALCNYSWADLAQLYRAGAGPLFEVATFNVYTATPAGVVKVLTYDRQTMNAWHNGQKPMLVTETGWTSAKGMPGATSTWDTTAQGQARNIAALIPMLAANRRSLNLRGFDYYTWIGDQSKRHDHWQFAGLLRLVNGQAVAKPALAAFTNAAHAIEH